MDKQTVSIEREDMIITVVGCLTGTTGVLEVDEACDEEGNPVVLTRDEREFVAECFLAGVDETGY